MNLSDFEGSVGFIGAGNMASALARGMVEGGLPPDRISLSDLDPAQPSALQSELGVGSARDPAGVVDSSSVVIIAVKPHVVPSLLEGLRAQVHDQLWISVAAGVPCTRMEDALGPKARVVRAMPNTPALVGEGATALCTGAKASDDDLALARALLATVGHTEVVPESLMDAVTGLSGSGPAFVMLFLEALADGAVREGLPRAIALRLAAQTVRGAATLLKETNKHPGELKDMVTSPGGTTIYGVEALEENAFRKAVMKAVIAATGRSRDFSR